MGSYFCVKGVEGGFEVLGELLKGFLRVSYGGIGHLVIPGFGIGGSSLLWYWWTPILFLPLMTL